MSTVTGPDAGGGSPPPVTSAGAGEPGRGDGGGQAGGGEGHRPRGRRTRAGVFLVAAAGVLVVAAGLATLAAHWPRSRPPAHPLRALRGTVFGLHTGQCIDTAPNGIGHARAVPCERTVVCEVRGASGTLTGSVRSSGR